LRLFGVRRAVSPRKRPPQWRPTDDDLVLVHCGWDGAWAWRPLAQELQRRGHEVYTPTLTGSGERVHVASREIGLHTHILDVVNVLPFEQLTEVVLVGFSYGGMVVTGVAEQLPDQISHLICLDGFVPANGQSIADLLGPQIMGSLNDVAQRYGDGWRVPSTLPTRTVAPTFSSGPPKNHSP
jgi:pimeloyl-ACP methyl ester carboxylesterase